MEKVEFPTNIPQILQLQFSEGKPVQSQFAGEQIMFTLVDGRRMYLAPFVADKIREAGIEARMPFEICKREVAKGKIQFEVKSLANPAAATGASSWQSSPAAAVRGNTEVHQQQNSSAAVQTDARAPHPAVPERVVTTQTARMMSCFLSAIDAVSEAQAYATRKGLGITFSSENVTSTALSCYINACREGR